MAKSSTKPAIAPTDAETWASRGGENIWLPYAQMKNAPVPAMAARTEGSRIILEDGRELIDGVASWWTACHGYNHPHIVAAMEEQLRRMPHVMFGGLNHAPALHLAQRLAAIAPGDLSRVFFSDSGSVAVEVALKMAVQYWLNKGEKGRTQFVSFRHAYHGDTAACMALAGPDPEMDEGLQYYLAGHLKDHLPAQFVVELPLAPSGTPPLLTSPTRGEEHHRAVGEINSQQDRPGSLPLVGRVREGGAKPGTEVSYETDLDTLLTCESHRIAAVIIEPLVQGVGGMKFHDAAVLRRVADLCRKHGVLLIADEIFTGFGRTGHMFACEEAGVVPDIMCLGKALTGGAIGLAATLARDHVFAAFLSDEPGKALMHGTTFMANPLACAAANASLDLFEREPRLAQVKKIEVLLREGLEPCRKLPGVVDVRVKGAIGVVQLEKIRDVDAMRRKFTERGVWIRPFGDIVYLTPALTIRANDLTKLTSTTYEVVSDSIVHLRNH